MPRWSWRPTASRRPTLAAGRHRRRHHHRRRAQRPATPFLDDIAHHAAPGTWFDHDSNPATPTIRRGQTPTLRPVTTPHRHPRQQRRLRRRDARLALHHRRRSRQREHRPDRASTRSSTPSTTASSRRTSRPSSRQRRPRLHQRMAAWTDITALAARTQPDRRLGLGRRAPVPGRALRHRDAVSAHGVRGVRPAHPADGRSLRLHQHSRHRSVDRRRVRPRGLPLRPLDADRHGRSARQRP